MTMVVGFQSFKEVNGRRGHVTMKYGAC